MAGLTLKSLAKTMAASNSGAFKPYVTSAFHSHSLTPTVGISSPIIGGVFKLTPANLIDVFGRPQGYLLSLIFSTMGLVTTAGCNGFKTVFCIITPAVTLPLFGLFIYRAQCMGLMPKCESNRKWWESIYHYAREFDAVGLLLITAGITLFLLPFNIYSYQTEQWKALIIIYFFIFDDLIIIAFAL
ncbi:Siderophore iron transporter mirB [Fusarium sp. LHS14.1]|nr:Siderophore iron transporter mirB [Fusarium sp. LHS14.1]